MNDEIGAGCFAILMVVVVVVLTAMHSSVESSRAAEKARIDEARRIRCQYARGAYVPRGLRIGHNTYYCFKPLQPIAVEDR